MEVSSDRILQEICVWKISPRSTQCTPVHSSALSTVCQKLTKHVANFYKIILNSAIFGLVDQIRPVSPHRHFSKTKKRFRNRCLALFRIRICVHSIQHLPFWHFFTVAFAGKPNLPSDFRPWRVFAPYTSNCKIMHCQTYLRKWCTKSGKHPKWE